MSNDTPEHHSVVIIGSGIAGYSAAIYAARAGHNPVVIRGDEPGGQLTLTTEVENYPGFPDGISGPQLIEQMSEQAKKFGATSKNAIVDDIDDSTRPFCLSLKNGNKLFADAVIAASGASARTLGIPGEDNLMGYGLSTCATCDGAFFKGEDMVVVGGGDAACEEANFLTKFANKVYIVHRRDEFRAEQVWIDKIEDQVENGNIELVLNSEVTEVHGTRESGIDSVDVVTHPDGRPTDKLDDAETKEWSLDIGAVFVAIGHTPNTDYLTDTGVELDENYYLKTQDTAGSGQTETGVDGLFGAGDVVDHHYQQAATAAGMGVKAALDVDAYLDEK